MKNIYLIGMISQTPLGSKACSSVLQATNLRTPKESNKLRNREFNHERII